MYNSAGRPHFVMYEFNNDLFDLFNNNGTAILNNDQISNKTDCQYVTVVVLPIYFTFTLQGFSFIILFPLYYPMLFLLTLI